MDATAVPKLCDDKWKPSAPPFSTITPPLPVKKPMVTFMCVDVKLNQH